MSPINNMKSKDSCLKFWLLCFILVSCITENNTAPRKTLGAQLLQPRRHQRSIQKPPQGYSKEAILLKESTDGFTLLSDEFANWTQVSFNTSVAVRSETFITHNLKLKHLLRSNTYCLREVKEKQKNCEKVDIKNLSKEVDNFFYPILIQSVSEIYKILSEFKEKHQEFNQDLFESAKLIYSNINTKLQELLNNPSALNHNCTQINYPLYVVGYDDNLEFAIVQESVNFLQVFCEIMNYRIHKQKTN